MRTFASKQERRTYQCWCDMRDRCNNPKHPRYARYGGRGIKVCQRWGSFENFVLDMGLKPAGMTIERIDNNGNYTPKNCKWATYREQNKNKVTTTTYTYKGKTQTIEEWAAEYGMGRTTLSNRIHRDGRTIAEALEQPVGKLRRNKLDMDKARQIRRLDAQGVSRAELARQFGVSRVSIGKVVNNEIWKEP